MKVKELYKKYEKEYTILLFGSKTRKFNSTPFTCLPKDKPLDECEVVEMEIDEEKTKIQTISLKTLKCTKVEYKGTIYALVR